MPYILSAIFSLLFCVSTFAQPQLIYNVQGYSFDHNRQLFSFSAIAFEHGKILATGSSELRQQFSDARQIDGQGQTLLPGLVDAHGHIIGLGKDLLSVDIRGVKSAEKTALRVQEYARQYPNLEWITGRGWNQVLWPGKTFPTASQLDVFIQDRPVWLRRVDGHAGWANSKALVLAGIDKNTKAPDGGEIIRDPAGEPTGLLVDNAMQLLEAHIPKTNDSFLHQALDAAGAHLLSLGITSAHDAGISYQQYKLYQQRATKQTLPIRIYAMLSATDPKLQQMLEAGYIQAKDDSLSIRSVKAYGDGALGSRGAALLQPYTDQQSKSGLLVTTEQELAPLFERVLTHKFQLNYHAIGDKANRLALDNYQAAFQKVGGKTLRHRVEHTQVVALDDIKRFKQLNIIPSMQPIHATSDMNMAEDRLGAKRLQGAYAWQTFLKQGSIIAAGSDFPVELANPFYGLHAAVTRQDRHNQPQSGWLPEQALSVEQALRAFTLDAAYAAHQEEVIGSLEPGKWADFILIDRNIIKGDVKNIWKTKVLQTWVAGQLKYQG